MSLKFIIYRVCQKFHYHFASDEFKKKAAEINSHEKIITIKRNSFFIKDCPLIFNKVKHEFILNGIRKFSLLLRQPDISFEIRNDRLICHIKGIKLSVYTAEELFIINEIWVDGCYNIKLKTPKPLIVIDVGMNVSYASLFFASQAAVHKVYSFEPFKPTFRVGLVNISYNSNISSKIKPHNFGLSSRKMTIKVDYSPEHRGRTGIWGTELILDKIKQKNIEKLTLEPFNSTIKSIIAKHLDCEFIWKIDCEGSEYDIFERIDKNLLKHVRAILMEWHKKGPTLLIQKLEENGFTTLSFNPTSTKVGMIYAFR